MFRVKICGIKEVDDLEKAYEFGADAAGFNFFRGSRRYIDPESCEGLISRSSVKMDFVGVFVDEDPDTINRIADKVGLNWVQLSGNEGEEVLSLIKRRTIKVFRPEKRSVLLEAESFPSDLVMFDSYIPGEFGGTGELIEGEIISSSWIKREFIIAGGLNPSNVADVIRAARPSGVDVASGVELYPGKKDHEKMHEFIRQSLEALGENS